MNFLYLVPAKCVSNLLVALQRCSSLVQFFGITIVLRKIGGTECPHARLLIEEVLEQAEDAVKQIESALQPGFFMMKRLTSMIEPFVVRGYLAILNLRTMC